VGLGEGALDLLRDLLRDFGWLKPRPKKRQKSKPVQPQLPGRPPPLPLRTTRVLPIQLQIGDRMTDSTDPLQMARLQDAALGDDARRVSRGRPRSF
jgi:hypothetical protein